MIVYRRPQPGQQDRANPCDRDRDPAEGAPAGTEQELPESMVIEDESACWCCATEGETCAPSNRSGKGRIVLAQCFKSRRALR